MLFNEITYCGKTNYQRFLFCYYHGHAHNILDIHIWNYRKPQVLLLVCIIFIYESPFCYSYICTSLCIWLTITADIWNQHINTLPHLLCNFLCRLYHFVLPHFCVAFSMKRKRWKKYNKFKQNMGEEGGGNMIIFYEHLSGRTMKGNAIIPLWILQFTAFMPIFQVL